MNVRLLLPLFVVLLISSCARVSNPSPDSSIAQHFIDDSCAVLSFQKEVLPIDLLYPTDMLTVDTFLLVSQHHDENIMQVYGTSSLKFLGSFLRKGGGPNEVMNFGLVSQSYVEDGRSKVVIQSYPNYLGVLDVGRSLEAGQAVYDKQYRFETHLGKELFLASHSVYVLDSARLMMTKDPLRSGVKFDNNFYWEFYDLNADKVTGWLKYENFPFMDSFLKESNRAMKPDRSKVALLYRFFDMISIADLKSGKVVQIMPEGTSLSPSVVEDVETRCLYYKMGECTDDYIFGLYANGLNVSKENDSRFNRNCSLRVYDWSGNLLYTYHFEDYIRMFTVDGQQRYLYAVTDSDAIIRYDLALKGQ